MRLAPGESLGPYEILAPLGAGGMGEVYRARDGRLGRTVAIKVLSPGRIDEDHQRRFVDEARTASAINYPNIAALYDIGADRGIEFIVMEYVAGTPLDRLIGRTGLSLADALKYAIQIADALASAHAIGIVHRDIKPGNIMIASDGTVKVLDFGLAKLARSSVGNGEESTRTLVQEAFKTRQGSIVGTAAYMSPEQAAGGQVDRRSDIFSFGAVLYELVTGQRAFTGESAMETISAVLKDEPKPVREIRAELPMDLERIVQRCLRKDRGRRFQYIDDVKIELLELTERTDLEAPVHRPSKPRLRYGVLWWPLAALLLLAAAWFVFGRDRPAEPLLAAVPLTTYPGSERFPAFSPDGNQVAFSWDGEKQDNFDIYIKLIGTGAPLRITSDPAPDFFPAWSPDGRWIAFLRLQADSTAAVLLVPALGGPERKLAETALYPQVAYVQGGIPPRIAWLADGNFLVIVDRASPSEPFGLYSLAVDTGEKRRLTMPPGNSVTDSGPSVSPDGQSVVFTRASGNIGVGDLYLVPVSHGMKPTGDPKRLTFDNRQNGHPAWTADGHDIIFSSPRAGGPLGLWRIAATGSGNPRRLPSVGEDGLFPAISRQGKRLVYTKYGLDSNIWRIEIQQAPGEPQELGSIPLVTSTRQDVMPQFSPDGRKVAFASDRSGFFQIWVCDADGSNAVQLTSLEGVSFNPAWSPDGKLLAFHSNVTGRTNVYVINSGGGKPLNLTAGERGGNWPTFSRDGRWVYFSSALDGRGEVWKTPSQGGDMVQVTRNGGHMPVESPDGQYLYFMRTAGTGPLYRVATGGGEETQVLGAVAARGYAVTNEGIYFFVPPKLAATREYYEVNANNSLQFFSFATGKTRVIATVQKPLQLGVSVSPDGRWILYPQIDRLVEDLMLVENFQ